MSRTVKIKCPSCGSKLTLAYIDDQLKVIESSSLPKSRKTKKRPKKQSDESDDSWLKQMFHGGRIVDTQNEDEEDEETDDNEDDDEED